MDNNTLKGEGKKHKSRKHQELEQMPRIQTLEDTTVSVPSAGHQLGGHQPPDEYELRELTPVRATYSQVPPEKHEWVGHDSHDRKCIIIEALVASFVVTVLVLATVIGTQMSARAHRNDTAPSPSPTSMAALMASEESVPVGTTFNASISVGVNCTGAAACDPLGPLGYTAGVSKNLYGAAAAAGGRAWSCGTCWQLTTLWGVANSSNITVTVVTDCPTTRGNGLCVMKTLGDENAHHMNVDFDLCLESGASEALLGNESLGLGEAKRVEC